ncbi:MAG: YlmC/YmxH family sporulation protein [Clostridia bacterium]
MNELTFCELKEKEVVNICDGKKLGRLLDMSFSLQGNIVGIIVPGDRRIFKNIAGGDSVFVPWKCIVKIGEDAILVELGGDVMNA